MESIPEKKQKNPGLAQVVFRNNILQLHDKISVIEDSHSISPEARIEEVKSVIDDFYDYLAIDELLEAREAAKLE